MPLLNRSRLRPPPFFSLPTLPLEEWISPCVVSLLYHFNRSLVTF